MLLDDPKLFAANDNQLASMIKIVSKFSDDIGMSFGIDKCKKLIIQPGKIVQLENIYKYLEFGESLTTAKTTKSSLKNKYFKQLKMILKVNFLVNTLQKKLTSMPSLHYHMGSFCSIGPSQSWK